MLGRRVVLLLFFLAASLDVVVVSAQKCRSSSGLRSSCDVAGRLAVCSSSAPGRGCVSCNQEVPRADFQVAPAVRYPAASQSSLYTLIMVDPDAPDHEPGRAWLHWIISNIPGRELQTGSFTSSTTVTDYLAPAPPDGSGAHRYFLLVYLQPGGRVSFSTPSRRPQFELATWIAAQYPYCLSGPTAANQFKVRFPSNGSDYLAPAPPVGPAAPRYFLLNLPSTWRTRFLQHAFQKTTVRPGHVDRRSVLLLFIRTNGGQSVQSQVP